MRMSLRREDRFEGLGFLAGAGSSGAGSGVGDAETSLEAGDSAEARLRDALRDAHPARSRTTAKMNGTAFATVSFLKSATGPDRRNRNYVTWSGEVNQGAGGSPERRQGDPGKKGAAATHMRLDYALQRGDRV